MATDLPDDLPDTRPVERQIGPRSERIAQEMPKGHPRGFYFFFWGEFAERCSFYGMRAILALYMTDKLGVSEGDAGSFMSLFIAFCYFFPLIGGYIADNFLGKYWTIVLFSVPYVLAQITVGTEDRAVVAGSLVLLAMGSGVIKPNITALMGLTYEQRRPGRSQLLTDAFSLFYMAINIGAFLSQNTMPWIRDNYGYQTAFLFPAGLMAGALVVFALGKRYYGRETIVRKVDAAKPVPPDTATFTGVPVHYEPQTADQVAADKKLKLETLGRIGALFATISVFWAIFDQSASTWIFFAKTYLDCHLFGYAVAPDRVQAFNALFIIVLVPLSLVVYRLVPIKATTKIAVGFGFTALSMAVMAFAGSQSGAASKQLLLTTAEGTLVLPYEPAAGADTTKGEFALPAYMTADKDTAAFDEGKKKWVLKGPAKVQLGGQTLTLSQGHLVNPPAADSLVGTSPVLESVYDYKPEDQLSAKESAARKKPGEATLEVTNWVKPSERATVWYQVLAYFIITIAEILVSVTGLELAFVAAPQSMKGFVTGCWLAAVGLGNLVINVPFTQMYPYLSPMNYFLILAASVAVVFVVYLPIASKFNRLMGANAADVAQAASATS